MLMVNFSKVQVRTKVCMVITEITVNSNITTRHKIRFHLRRCQLPQVQICNSNLRNRWTTWPRNHHPSWRPEWTANLRTSPCWVTTWRRDRTWARVKTWDRARTCRPVRTCRQDRIWVRDKIWHLDRIWRRDQTCHLGHRFQIIWVCNLYSNNIWIWPNNLHNTIPTVMYNR